MPVLLQDIFRQAIDYLTEHELFYGHGVAEAEDEVVLLLMHVLQVDFATLNAQADAVVEQPELDQIQAILSERVTHKVPMAYLVGFSVFAGLRFAVDQRVLIPRSPFVELIDQGFAPWVNLQGPVRVLDLCTGSGCIGLAIAHYFPETTVTLADLSEDALAMAEKNTAQLQLSTRVNCVQSDLFDALEGPYDLIVSNPPYVADDEYRDLPQEYRHEPRMALVSAKCGMEIPVKILLQAADFLTEQGYLFLEVGYNDAVLSACLPAVPLEWLDLSVGGQGICVFSCHDLLKYRPAFKEFLSTHVT